LKHGYIAFDDDILIYENPLVWEISTKTLYGIFTSYDPELYIPLTFLSYQIDYALGGGSAFWFHLTNLLLHTINSLLVCLLAFRLSKGKLLLALGCGLLFAIHPLHTEAVAWASSRKDQLSTLFYLSSLIVYIRYVRTSRQSFFIWCIVLTLLGFLSKIMLATIPAILLLIDYYEKRPIGKRVLIEKIPFIGLSALFAVIAIYGKQHMIHTSSTGVKILMAFKSTSFYLQKLILPTKLSVVYPFDKEIHWWLPDFIIPIIVVSLLIIFTIWCFRNNRVIFFGFSFFFITVSPTFLNFAKAGEIFVASDRYAYLPSVSLFYLVSLGFWKLVYAVPRFKNNAWILRLIGLLICSILLVFALLAHRQVSFWSNDKRFFTHSLEYYPNSYVAQNNLGNALLLEGDYTGAIAAYENAIAINPKSLRARGNLALAYGRTGRMDEAIEQLQIGLGYFPNSAELILRLGDIFIMQGDHEEALKMYKRAAVINPRLLERKYHAIQASTK